MPVTLSSKADLRQELLTLLSPTPARIDDVADDLKIRPAALWSIIRQLQNDRYAIETAADPCGAVVFINPAGWARARGKAERYFDRMYG